MLLHKVVRHRGYEAALRGFLKIKLEGRAFARKSECPNWKQGVRMGLYRQSPKNNRVLILAGFSEFSDGKGKQGTHRAEFTRDEIINGDMAALCFAAIEKYSLEAQVRTAQRARGGRESAPRRRGVRESLHNGGISLSLMAEKTGKSKSTASRMRKRGDKAGYCCHTRRSILVSHAAGDERQRVQPDSVAGNGRLWTDAHGVLRKEITSECRSAVTLVAPSFKRGRKNRPSTQWKKAVDQGRRAWYDH